MSTQDVLDRADVSPRFPPWLKKGGYGFAYWVLFLLVLEPGNAMRAARAGHALALHHEVARITAAAILGTLVTPVLLFLTGRFPLWGARRWQYALVHTGTSAAMAFGLIAVSCFVAVWTFDGKLWPTLAAVHDQLVGNWLLLTYALLALTGLLHFTAAVPRPQVPSGGVQSRPRTHIPVRTRGSVELIELANVDWIEAQGNYLALHVGARSHLVRDTVTRIETELDASRFVRIHRRAIVAVDRIASVQRLAKGDARVILHSGSEIRASRRYRQALWDQWSSRR
jgi:DNA-binding LytR/AlgR family response regulator